MPAKVEPEAGSQARRQRRTRVLDATLAIASQGGFEAVQMRAVAERAGIAVGTLYSYFPSKVHLLVTALGREFERIDTMADYPMVRGSAPQRLHQMISGLNRSWQRHPLLTEAMTRAFAFADDSVAAELDHVATLADGLLARAISDGKPTEEQYQLARVISDVWLSNLLAWVNNRASTAEVNTRLDLAIRLLTSAGQHPDDRDPVV